jgi:glutathione S-transferase
MQLYYAPASPYVRKVMVLLNLSERMGEVAMISAAGNPTAPGTMPVDQNPLGKIPALLRDDGPALFDSRVICRYLDHRFHTGLYPDAPRLWNTLTLEATGDGIMDAAVLMVYEIRVRPEEMRFSDWVEGQWAKIDRALDALESQWLDHLMGPVDIGQIAVGCALGYLDFRHDQRGWRNGRPNLTKWHAAFDAGAAMQATRPVA